MDGRGRRSGSDWSVAFADEGRAAVQADQERESPLSGAARFRTDSVGGTPRGSERISAAVWARLQGRPEPDLHESGRHAPEAGFHFRVRFEYLQKTEIAEAKRRQP